MTQVHQAAAARSTAPSRWIELSRYNKLWARYNPATNQIEFARRDVRVVFDLDVYKTRALHKEKDGVI